MFTPAASAFARTDGGRGPATMTLEKGLEEKRLGSCGVGRWVGGVRGALAVLGSCDNQQTGEIGGVYGGEEFEIMY
jgi:hypothetical protein